MLLGALTDTEGMGRPVSPNYAMNLTRRLAALARVQCGSHYSAASAANAPARRLTLIRYTAIVS